MQPENAARRRIDATNNVFILSWAYSARVEEKKQRREYKPPALQRTSQCTHTVSEKDATVYRARFLQSRKNFTFPRGRRYINELHINGLQVDGSSPLR